MLVTLYKWNLEESLESYICMKELIVILASQAEAPEGTAELKVLFMFMVVTDPGTELLSVENVSSELESIESR